MNDELQGTPGTNAASNPLPGTPPAAPHRDSPEELAKILQEIKLPARKDMPGVEPAAPKQIPTAIPDLDAIVPQKTAVPEPAPENQGDISPLRTLKDDLKDVVRDNKISVVKAAALESDKRAKINEYETRIGPENTHAGRGMKIVVSILALFILGGGALFAIYYVEQQKATPIQTGIDDSLLFAEQTFPFPIQNLSSRELKNAFAQLRTQAGVTLGAIVRLVPQTGEEPNLQPATTREFLTAIGANPPEELLRALEDSFFFGIHAVDENAPILIIPVNSYERAFAGMLAWEKDMNSGLSPLFTPVPATISDENGVPRANAFEDLVMRNYDVRAQKDLEGQIQLYYSFPTRNVLIIAESSYSFVEILSRLRAERRI